MSNSALALFWIAFAGSVLALAGHLGLWVYYRRTGCAKPPVLAGSISGSIASVLLFAVILRGVDRPFGIHLMWTSVILMVVSTLLLMVAMRRRARSFAVTASATR